jgi:hypothetical protein
LVGGAVDFFPDFREMSGNEAVSPLKDRGCVRCGKHAGIGNAGLHSQLLEGQSEVARRAVMTFTEGSCDNKDAFLCRHDEFARSDFKTECGIASMDFSAFLGLPMQKKDDSTIIRPSDDGLEAEFLSSDDQPMGENEEIVRLEGRDRSELKFRTHEPKLEERPNQDDVTMEDEWNTPVVAKASVSLHKGFWILIAVILLAGVSWLVYEFSQLKRQEKVEVVRPIQNFTKSEEQSEIELRQTIATIHETVRKFYASSSVSEMLQYVRHPDQVGESMKKHYMDHPLSPSEVIDFKDITPLTIGLNGGFWIVLTKMNTGLEGKLVVEVYSPTDVRVDWETFVCAQPMNWDQFVKSRPAPYRGDFRVYVALDSFYNYEFEDSDKYQSFKLTALNSEEVIHGYVVRGSEAFRVIELSLKQNGNKKVPMLLRLNLQEGLQSKSGVLIEDVVAPRWLIINSREVKK